MTEQMQEAKATPAAQKAKAKSHPSNTIQTSSEIISVDEPENALPEVSLADLPQLLQTACAKAGWNSLMPVQSRALPYLLEGRDLMVQSRTGSGKTGTYLLPLMARLNPAMPAVQALILVPTRELAVQVEQEAKTLFKGSGFTVAAVYGGVGYGKQMDALRQGVSVVVGTPGRVLDHLLRRTLNLDHISALIFDEADRMLSIGFYPDMKEIQRYLPETSIHAMLFSATYPPHVLKLAGEFLTDPQMLSLSTTQIHVAEVQHLYCECKSMEKDRTLIKILEVENPASAIIFCNTKATVHFGGAVLQGFGFNADELSADLSQSRREDVLSRLRKGTIRFLVATDVAARGIDIPELSHVFLYEPPDDRESYIHRAGRTGRAGAAGVVISLVDIMEKMELQRIAKYFKVPLTQHMAPTDEEVAHAVGMRVTALLEARFRQLNGLERERMKRFEPLVQNYFEQYLGQFPAQVFDKINENFIRCSFYEVLSRYLSNCYTFAVEQNLPSGRADLVLTGISGTAFHNDCRVVEFKYFKAKDATMVEALKVVRPEDADQVRRYAADINRQFPAYRMRAYVVYIAAGKVCKTWEVINL